MYVHYIPHTGKHIVLRVDDVEWAKWSWNDDYTPQPNYSVWMVPGTVDPLED